jgi:hypothetical protein
MRQIFVKNIFLLGCLFIQSAVFAQADFNKHLIEVQLHEADSINLNFVKTPELFVEQWDTLAQPSFWKFVMRMSPETSILNVASTREVLELKPLSEWNALSDEAKEDYRVALRKEYGLAEDERIFMTTGKNDFFQFDKVFPSISKGVEVFVANNTDPWYAQAILMIESPGKIAYSNVGALGPFQLMKSVARNHGLTVNKYVDERKDFEKSAAASAHLIRTACIPEAKRILKKFDIEVSPEEEHSLWFRLIVMHCYHAGAGNVDGVLSNVVKPKMGGQELITELWKSEYGNFRNASQNYSQLALAALIILDDLILTKCSEICEYEIF